MTIALGPSRVDWSAAPVQELVAGVREHRTGAFDELYRRFAPSVHTVLLSRLTPGEAEDATQEVFMTAHRKLQDLRNLEAIGPWLHAMARNAATDRLRARLRGPRSEPLREELAGAAVEGASDSELRGRVLHHIQSLPQAYRETLVMRLVEGLTGPDIAGATGLSPGSVRVNLHRGMELLRPLLHAEGWP
jgi:RNA polymerase sigma-70 factor (ECF subfamily)